MTLKTGVMMLKILLRITGINCILKYIYIFFFFFFWAVLSCIQSKMSKLIGRINRKDAHYC